MATQEAIGGWSLDGKKKTVGRFGSETAIKGPIFAKQKSCVAPVLVQSRWTGQDRAQGVYHMLSMHCCRAYYKCRRGRMGMHTSQKASDKRHRVFVLPSSERDTRIIRQGDTPSYQRVKKNTPLGTSCSMNNNSPRSSLHTHAFCLPMLGFVTDASSPRALCCFGRTSFPQI